MESGYIIIIQDAIGERYPATKRKGKAMSLTEDIKDFALDLGYSRVGITTADPFPWINLVRSYGQGRACELPHRAVMSHRQAPYFRWNSTWFWKRAYTVISLKVTEWSRTGRVISGPRCAAPL